jgi:hypothetical protein
MDNMLKLLWRRFLADRVTRSVSARMGAEIERLITSGIQSKMAITDPVVLSSYRLEPEVEQLITAGIEARMALPVAQTPWKANLHMPSIGLHPPIDGPFMAHSTCCARDFLHPEFNRLCAQLGMPPTYHRKQWEWVAVLHHAVRTGAVGRGKRGLGFAVGTEPLPSAFAKTGTSVTATDAPEEIGIGAGWQQGGQHSSRLDDLYNPNVVDRATFEEKVTFATCDMRNISADLTDYDFCWSSCSFEHLGTLQAGLDFVVESVEKTLKPGGVACHTTEFNLSSDADTIEAGSTVLYRKQDVLGLIDRLEKRGHLVDPFSIAPDTHVLDFFVDTPPYGASPHLKLQLLGYVSTSMVLVIRRGH